MNKVKNILIGICAICLLSGVPLLSHAQVGEFRKDLAIGFNGGVNLNSIGFTPTIKQGSLMGMTGELLCDIPVKSILQPLLPYRWKLITRNTVGKRI